jgi:hypothetical protein
MSVAVKLETPRVSPGAMLRGSVVLDPPPGEEQRRVELSVLWEAFGKGTTDMGVVLFSVLADDEPTAARSEHSFETRLPLLPLSYDGNIVKIGWLVRVRRVHPTGADLVLDEPFTMELEP